MIFCAARGSTPRFSAAWRTSAAAVLERLEDFRRRWPAESADENRIPKPKFRYYGRDIWQKALIALLAGPKATGKNVLAENLAAVFGRPAWDISFYLNTDAASLIGTDTFLGGEVRFRKGPVTQCAQRGGFGVLDEINMAKNECVTETELYGDEKGEQHD